MQQKKNLSLNPCYYNRTWRINNLYSIKDKSGNKIPFKPNWAQGEILDTLHTCEIVLKCRQLGMTTFFCILLLDAVLWSFLEGRKIQAGIIAHTLQDSQDIFKEKLKFTFDHLDPRLRAIFKTVGDSAREISFSHGSSIKVGTSLRSSTLQYLHISEFGKVCAKFPEKAREIMSGALNTIQAGQNIYIESTAEGKEGRYYDMIQEAKLRYNESLGVLDYKYRFFPWWREPAYVLNEHVTIKSELLEYFERLKSEGIELTDGQKNWYSKKYETQKDDMKREYPSTDVEAFEASQVGNWYAEDLREVYDNGRVCCLLYNRELPVHTAWDLGQRDPCAIWFFQLTRTGDIHLIDYFQRSDTKLDVIVTMLQQKGYTYGTHIWPFDANARDKAGITFVQQAHALNLTGLVLEQHKLIDGINLTRSTLSKCYFDKTRCLPGLICLENYKKRWNTTIGGFSSEPVHDESSHGADAFRYLCAGYQRVTGADNTEAEGKALRNYFAF